MVFTKRLTLLQLARGQKYSQLVDLNILEILNLSLEIRQQFMLQGLISISQVMEDLTG